jgi:hypothetical protein
MIDGAIAQAAYKLDELKRLRELVRTETYILNEDRKVVNL